MKDIHLVYNPKSGSAVPLSELRAKCKAAGLTIKKFIPVDAQLARQLARPIAHGNTIIVIGGDGTINSLINMVAGTRAILAPIPGGTFNHFTRDLGIPQDIDEALVRMKRATVKSIDMVKVSDRVFVNNSLLGLYPYSLQIRAKLEGRFGKWLSALVGVTRCLTDFHTYRIEIDGTRYKTPFVFVGNNNFGLERLGLPGRKRFDGKVMSVYIARAHSRLQVAKLFMRAVFKSLEDADEFEVLKVRDSFTVTSHRKTMHVSFDGELSRMKTPITYTILPKSLRILH